MTPDEHLHRQWAEGDRRSGERLIDRYLRAMKRFFANKAADSQDVEDLVASTFERCARGLESFRGESSFRTYIYGIARNVLREYARARMRRNDEVDLEAVAACDLGPSPSSLIVERAEQRLLLEGLRGIPLDLQIVLEMKYFEGRTVPQIAEILALPVGTVSTRARRGRQLLAEVIERLAETPGQLETTLGGLPKWAESVREQLDAMLSDNSDHG